MSAKHCSKLLLISSVALITFVNVFGGPEDEPPVLNLQAVSIQIENQSGESVDLWWVPKYEKRNPDAPRDPDVYQGTLQTGETVKINSFVNHNFKFTAQGDASTVLHEFTVYKHLQTYTLLSRAEMMAQKKEMVTERRAFSSEYKERTGRKWLNYYPRPEVEHFVHDITDIGQEIHVRSRHLHFVECPSSIINDEVVSADLAAQQQKWQEENPGVEFKDPVCHAFVHADGNVEVPIDTLTNTTAEGVKVEDYHCEYVAEDTVARDDSFPPFFSVETDDYIVYEWGGKHLCKPTRMSDYSVSLSLNVLDNGEVWNILFCDVTCASDDGYTVQRPDEQMEISMEVLCTEPRVVSIRGFLSAIEANHIIEMGQRNGLVRSTVAETATVTKDRTSSTIWLKRYLSPVIEQITLRIADVTGVDERRLYLNMSCEDLQLVHYTGGQLYKSHYDYGTDSPMNRFITFLMYLNNVETGGNTSFPSASKECKGNSDYFGVHPEMGRAVFFYDLYADGNVDPSTLHYAEPPGEGSEKWMTNLWIWDPFFPFN